MRKTDRERERSRHTDRHKKTIERVRQTVRIKEGQNEKNIIKEKRVRKI